MANIVEIKGPGSPHSDVNSIISHFIVPPVRDEDLLYALVLPLPHKFVPL